MAKLVSTRIALDEKTRKKIIDILQPRLADAIDLMTIAKQAHWNVRGPEFMSLHKMFDDLHDVVEDAADELAERIAALGGTARGTARMVAEASTLKPYPAEARAGRDHVLAVAAALADFGGKLRQSAADADKAGDPATEDLCVGLIRDIDKWTWFVEAHVQE